MPVMRQPKSLLTGEPLDPNGVMIAPAMVGGLPDGLNPGAIEELLKRLAPTSVKEAAKPVVAAATKLRQPIADAAKPGIDKAEQFMKYIRNFIPNK